MSPKLRTIFLGALLGIAQACALEPEQVAGCYLAEPALTYSAEGKLERWDSTWSYARLSADGKARRPLLKRNFDHDQMSEWRIEGRTLHVTFADGLVGWQVQLEQAPKGWAGRATYITDAPEVGAPPIQQPITLTRRSCE
jgi:hypothetical protein